MLGLFGGVTSPIFTNDFAWKARIKSIGGLFTGYFTPKSNHRSNRDADSAANVLFGAVAPVANPKGGVGGGGSEFEGGGSKIAP